jgi:dephospho-CoA kinase
MKRKLICITGPPGSGKSFIASVGEKMGLRVYAMGDVVREEAMKRYGKFDKDIVGKLAKKLREEYGEDAVANLLVKNILDEEHDKEIIIDGIRSPREIDVFKEYFDVIVIGVIASRATRYERILLRRRRDDIEGIDDFMERENREIAFGVMDALFRSDIYFFNEGIDKRTAEKYAEKLFRMILKERV